MTPSKSIERLSLYRRILFDFIDDDTRRIHSHDLARLAQASAAQVRRDLMLVGYEGCPRKGYDVAELERSISELLDIPDQLGIALVGIGNLGRALMAYFSGKQLSFRAAFDQDPDKVGRVLHGCRCYDMTELANVVAAEKIDVAVISVPAVQAQDVTDQLLQAGVRGFLNFAPVALRVPQDAYVETIDLGVALEKVAFFARQKASS